MKCLVCGEELPLLSKVCPVCGHVINGENGETLKASEYIASLDSRLSEIKKMPMPTFGQSIKDMQVIICPLLAITCLILALITDAGLFWIACGLFLILFIVFLIINLTAKSFNKKKIEFEEEMKTAKRYFGKNREVSKELETFSEEIASIEKKRKALSRKNTIIWLVIVAIIIIAVIVITMAVNGPGAQEIVDTTSAQQVVNQNI